MKPDNASNEEDKTIKTIKKRLGRPKANGGTARANASSASADTKKETLPGHINFPINDFSLTITKTCGDVAFHCLEIIFSFIKQYCLKGGVSTEVGHRANNLHLQAVVRIQYPSTKVMEEPLRKFIKKLLPDAGKSCKVQIKVIGVNQKFSAMVGYITKDETRPSYQIRTHYISPQELSEGRQDHMAMCTSYDDNKKLITMRNMVAEIFKFNLRMFFPFVVPVQYYCSTRDRICVVGEDEYQMPRRH